MFLMETKTMNGISTVLYVKMVLYWGGGPGRHPCLRFVCRNKVDKKKKKKKNKEQLSRNHNQNFVIDTHMNQIGARGLCSARTKPLYRAKSNYESCSYDNQTQLAGSY